MTQHKIALITGSGKKRVGYFVARHLAKQGYDLAIHYRTSEQDAFETAYELQTFGIRAKPFHANLAIENEVNTMVQAVFEEFGSVDVLVNAAAIWNRKRLEDVQARDVIEHFETNTLGTFLMCQQVGLKMVEQASGGVIINIGDWAEVRPYLDYAAYFPSKGAVSTLTRSFAVELGSRNPNIRVNCILPGPVMLPPEMRQAEKEEVVNATLVKREGSPDNVAKAVLSLIENDFITGVCLPVDGGRTVYAG
jgi:pteridine reductase